MKNYIVKLFLSTIAVFVTAYLLRDHGVNIGGPGWAVVIAFTLSILNVSVKPLLIVFTLPATILSLGLFMFVINTIIIKIAAHIIGPPGFQVIGWWPAFLFSLLLSLLNSILDNLIKAEAMSAPKDEGMKIYDKDGNRIA